MPKKPPELVYGVEDKPPLLTCLLLGLQHIFIITIVLVFPVVIVRSIGGTPEQAGFFVSMSMLASGVGTILQALKKKGIGSGYLCPSVCGPSYLPASLLAAQTGGLSLLFGMTAIAGSFEVLLSRIMHRLRALFPTEVTGLVVLMVGIAVIPIAISNFMGIDATDTVTKNPELIVGFVTLGTMVGLNVWSKGKLKLYSVLIGMILGYICAFLLGILNVSHIELFRQAPLIAFPNPEYFGWSFDLTLLVPFLIVMICSSLKSVGVHDNPSMESYPASYVLNPAVIAKNDNMISINSILEVDLLGQCNAEFLAGSQFSGTGGQLDFVRGAFDSRGGKSILAFYSTARKGEVSRVVPRFETGTVVTTPRMETHYLVTEYGAVNLKGKSTRERALDIISIAHPKFRDDLLREAENMYLL